MNSESPIHNEGSISPSLPHIFSTIKSEPSDFWNPQTPPPVSSGLSENYSTYTPLETLHPESSYAQYLTVMNSVPPYGSYAPLCSSYSSVVPEDSENSVLHGSSNHPSFYRTSADVLFFPRDEGLGSSPSSLNSSSPPSMDHMAPVVSTANNHHYYDQNERSSPGDSAYSEELPLPRLVMHPQCVKCGISGSDIWWRDATGHFLCASCCQGRNPLVPTLESMVSSHDVEYDINDRKRKRPSNVSKKDNQSCTNCDSVTTSLWRRNLAGEVVCNACGLYEKLHKCARPISMKKDTIQTRKRKPRGTGSKKKCTAANNVTVNSKENIMSPASYTLPTYSTLHARDSSSNYQPIHDPAGTTLPPISSAASFYANYKQEINIHQLVPPSVISLSLTPTTMSSSPSPTNI